MAGIILAVAAAICLTGCAPKETPPLATVDGAPIMEEEYLYWLDLRLARGETMPEADVKAQALTDALVARAVGELAAEAGMEAAADLEALGRQYDALAQRLTEAELEAFGAAEGYCRIDRLLLPRGEGEKAAAIFAQLNGQTEYDVFAAARDMGLDTQGPRQFRLGEGTMEAVLEEAGAALRPGAISGILETREGLSILYCLPLKIGELRIPCLDKSVSQRVEGMTVLTHLPYDSVNISARFDALSGENVGNSGFDSSK